MVAPQSSALPIVGNGSVFALVPNRRWRPRRILISFRVWSISVSIRHWPATPNTAIPITVAVAITIARRPITFTRIAAVVTAVGIIAVVAWAIGIITVVAIAAAVSIASFDKFTFDVTALIDEMPSARVTSIVVPMDGIAATVAAGIVTLFVITSVRWCGDQGRTEQRENTRDDQRQSARARADSSDTVHC